MKRSTQFKAKFAAVRDKLAALLDSIGDSDISAEQQTQIDAYKAEMAKHAERIKTEEELEEAERRVPAARSTSGRATVEHGFERDPARGFGSHREFLVAVRGQTFATHAESVTDERLRSVAADAESGPVAFLLPNAFAPADRRGAVGSDEHSTKQDQYGGYSVRDAHVPGLWQVNPEADPTAGRVQNLPMEAPTVKITARTDKDHTTSVSGGLRVMRRNEMAQFQSSRMSMERITLTASMLAGLTYETEELLTDSLLSFIALIDAGFRNEFPAKKFQEKLYGGGGDEYLGILTGLASASLGPTVTVAKESSQSAASIIALNVLNMRARCWGYGDAIWIANHDCYPQLAQMVVGSGNIGGLVYQHSLVEGRPDTLLGRPIFYSEYAATMGTIGDLVLANWSQYLEGVLQPLQSASSVHVRFETHEQTFKFWERNAGAPWWRTAITPKKGANTLSPFVVLATRP